MVNVFTRRDRGLCPTCWCCGRPAERFYSVERMGPPFVVEWSKRFPNGVGASAIPESLLCADCTDIIAGG